MSSIFFVFFPALFGLRENDGKEKKIIDIKKKIEWSAKTRTLNMRIGERTLRRVSRSAPRGVHRGECAKVPILKKG